MTSIAYLNGEFVAEQDAKVSVFDRGFMFADGIYEVIPVYHGKAFRLADHLKRLQNGLDGLGIKNPYESAIWEEVVSNVIAKNTNSEADKHQSLYIQVTRGNPGYRDHQALEGYEPTVLVYTKVVQPKLLEIESETGLKVVSLEDFRWQRGDLKTVGLIGSVMLRQQALSLGGDDGLLFRGEQLTEATASNVFLIKDQILYTPPKSRDILPGITRDVILELALSNGIEVKEQPLTKTDVLSADEIWISSSTKEIAPVVILDDKPVGDGRVGPMWAKIAGLFNTYKQRLLAST